MAYKTIYQGVLFVEGELEGATLGHPIDFTLSSFSAQLKNLNEVKAQMALEAKRLGHNCVVNFTYGQRHEIFRFDDVVFWGKGIAASIPQIDFDRYQDRLNKR